VIHDAATLHCVIHARMKSVTRFILLRRHDFFHIIPSSETRNDDDRGMVIMKRTKSRMIVLLDLNVIDDNRGNASN
jgi:hypothetical protein